MTTSFECPICYVSIDFQDPHVKTACKHDFCFDCYTSHQYSGNNFSHTCPICRAQIRPPSSVASPSLPTATAQSRVVLSLLDFPIRDVDEWPSTPAPVTGDGRTVQWSFSDMWTATSHAPPSQATPSVFRHSRDSGVAQSPSHIRIPSPRTATSNQEDELSPTFIRPFLRHDEA
jgi:hypothetical protein